jgi:hypothetical protein
MKTFFWVLLLVSVAMPVFLLQDMIRVQGHNQWKSRPVMRADATKSDGLNAGDHFGLTGAQIAELDERVAAAYSKSVDDGCTLGRGYERLLLVALVLDGLLFVASLIGLRGSVGLERLTTRCNGLAGSVQRDG